MCMLYIYVCVYIHTYMYEEIYYEILAYVIIEAGTSQNLHLEGGDPGKLMVQLEGPRSNGVDFRSGSEGPGALRAGEDCVQPPADRQCAFNSPPPPPRLFYPASPWPTHTVRTTLYSVHQFQCSSLLTAPSQTHPEITCDQISRHSTAPSDWRIAWSITGCFSGAPCGTPGSGAPGLGLCWAHSHCCVPVPWQPSPWGVRDAHCSSNTCSSLVTRSVHCCVLSTQHSAWYQ